MHLTRPPGDLFFLKKPRWGRRRVGTADERTFSVSDRIELEVRMASNGATIAGLGGGTGSGDAAEGVGEVVWQGSTVEWHATPGEFLLRMAGK